MPVFILSRLFSALLVLLGVSFLVFLLIHLVPGDPVEVMLGEAAHAADREALRHALGLDQSLPLQLVHYFNGLLHLDLGTSLQSKRPITELLWERIPAVGHDKSNYCITCHGDIPHDKVKEIRAFGNMHSSFISCQACHIRLEGAGDQGTICRALVISCSLCKVGARRMTRGMEISIPVVSDAPCQN